MTRPGPIAAALLFGATVFSGTALAADADTAQDRLTPKPPPGWDRPAAENAPATAVGRQYGAPAGDALASPANPAARAEDAADQPGLSDGALGADGGPSPDGAVVVDEVPMRRLNDAGTAATSAKTGLAPAPDTDGDTASATDQERLGAPPGDETLPAEIDIQRAWKPVEDPPHADPQE